ncbi:MAG: phosphotyrosine protein phosphatase [Pseudomonadota bacterium]
MAAYLWHATLGATGFYNRWASASELDVDRIVFVCAGNICRSPFAELVARRYDLSAASVGLSTRGGDPADPSATRAAAAMGISLDAHRSARIDSLEITDRDLLVCMEPSQARQVERIDGVKHVVLLGMLGTVERPYIPDPFGRSDDYFLTCFDWIASSVSELADCLDRAKIR